MTDIFRADPKRPSYQGSSQPLDPNRCKAGVWGSERWSFYKQCSKKAGIDGWCKQHHPDAEADRERKQNEAHEAKMRKAAMGWYGARLVAALKKIEAGDNDPRTTARNVLIDIGELPKEGPEYDG